MAHICFLISYHFSSYFLFQSPRFPVSSLFLLYSFLFSVFFFLFPFFFLLVSSFFSCLVSFCFLSSVFLFFFFFLCPGFIFPFKLFPFSFFCFLFFCSLSSSFFCFASFFPFTPCLLFVESFMVFSLYNSFPSPQIIASPSPISLIFSSDGLVTAFSCPEPTSGIQFLITMSLSSFLSTFPVPFYRLDLPLSFVILI